MKALLRTMRPAKVVTVIWSSAVHLLLFTPVVAFLYLAGSVSAVKYIPFYKKAQSVTTNHTSFTANPIVGRATTAMTTMAACSGGLKQWDGGGPNNNWSEPMNWCDDTLPALGSIVVFDGTSNKSAVINIPASVQAIQINAGFTNGGPGTGEVSITAGVSLTVGSGNWNQNAGAFIGGNGDIQIDGHLTLNGGAFTVPSGTLSLARDLAIGSGGTFIGGTGTVAFIGGSGTALVFPLNSTVVMNNVTINKTGGSVVTFNNTGTLRANGILTLTDGSIQENANNSASGTLEAQGDVMIDPTFDGGVGGFGSALLLISGAATRTVTLPAGVGLPRLTVSAAAVTLNTSGAGSITFPQAVNLSALSVTNGAVNFVFNNTFTLGVPTNFTQGSGNLTFNNTFLQNGGTFTPGSGAVTLNLHLTINGGTFNAPSGTLSLARDLTIGSGSTFIGGTGTVAFIGGLGAGLVFPSGSTVVMNNLTINKTGGSVVTFNNTSTLRANGTLTLTDGSIQENANNGASGTLEAQGDVMIDPTFDGGVGGFGSALLLISGAATRIVTLPVGASFPRFRINAPAVTLNTSGSPGTITFTQPMNVDSALSLTNGAVDFVFSGTFAFGGSTNFTQGSGNLTFDNTFTQSSGTFTPGSGALAMNSNLTINGGIFTTPSGTLNLGRDLALAASATFTANTGTVAFTGGTSGGLLFPLNSTVNLNNVIVNKTGGAALTFNLTSTLKVNGSLTLTDGSIGANANNGATGTVEAQGDVTVLPTFDGGVVRTTFSGTNNQTFTNTGGANPTGTWTINKSGGALILATNLNVGSSVLNLTDGTINTTFGSAPNPTGKEGAPNVPEVVGNMLDTQGSNVNIGATLDGGTATIAFTGGTARTVTMPAGVVMPNVLLNAASATLSTSGAGTVTMSNLEVQAGTMNLSAVTADINGSFRQSGGTFTAPIGNLFLAGNFTHTAAGGTFNASNGTFVFDGPLGQVADVNVTETFNILTLNKTGINNNDVLSIAAGDTLVASNTLDLQNGEIWGATIQVPNAMTVAATFADGGNDGGTGTIAITGATARTITIPVGAKLPNINFNAPNVTLAGSGPVGQAFSTRDFTMQAGTISLNVNLAVKDFILTGGTFNAPPSVNLRGNFTHTAGGTFNHNNGGISLLGTSTVFDANGTENFFRLSFGIGGSTINLSGDTLIVLDQLSLGGGTVNNGFIEAPKNVILGSLFAGGNATINVVGSTTRTITVPGGAILPNFVLNAANVTMTGGTASSSFATFRSMNLQAGTIQPGNVPWRFSQFYTQSGGVFASGAKDIDFDGDFTITGDSAAFTTSQANTFFGGNFTDTTPSGFSGTPGSVTFDGSSTQNIDVGLLEEFTVLNIAPADGVALNIISGQRLVADSSLTLTNGQVNTGSLYSSGNLTVASGFDGGTANVRVLSFVTYTNNGGINPTGTWTMSSSLSLASDLDLSNGTGALVLQSGIIATGTHTINAGERTVTRTSGFVAGNLQRSFSTTGTKIFDISNGATYSPVTVDVTALGVSPSSLKIGTTAGTHPSLDPLTSLNKYWTITETGDLTATLTFRYLDPQDISGDENLYRIFRITGGVPASFPNNCPGSPCVDTTTNTATIADVSQFSDWSLGDPGSPTAVELTSFNAESYDNGDLLEWQTGLEVNNLGFRIYRDQAGTRAQLNREIVAGSALVAGSGTVLTAGRGYAYWVDAKDAGKDAAFWLEDIDLNGESTWHGPIFAKQVGGKPPVRSLAESLSQVGRASDVDATHAVESSGALAKLPQSGSSSASLQQASLASSRALKIGVRQSGWYRITQGELINAGLDPKTDPRTLRLFVDGIELPIYVAGEDDGRFDANDSVGFYGLGLNTPSTDTRVYWLIGGSQPGLRINKAPFGKGYPSGESFPYTVERRDRTIYFSALRNGDEENFFGAVISSSPVDQRLTLNNLGQSARESAIIEVSVQGVTNLAHQVSLALNGSQIGQLSFNGQSKGQQKIEVPQAQLREGENIVTLQSINGPSDISLVDSIRITYQHSYRAENDSLGLTARPGETATVSGFSSKDVRVFDVTDDRDVQELAVSVDELKDGYAATVTAPSAGIKGVGSGERKLLVLTEHKALQAPSLTANTPSQLRDASNSADFIMIGRVEFQDSLKPLASLRTKQGLKTALVDIEDVYDEFSFGDKSPQSIKDFLSYAASKWKLKPRFVLLAGDASYDARNYLGLGDRDLVPTKLIDTAYLETASDDWLADFDGDGVADLAIGRLPICSAEEASLLVSKIIAYESSSPSKEALLVADANDGFDFEGAANQLAPIFPPGISITQINRGRAGTETAKKHLLDGIQRGQKVVNYTGHGSANVWRGDLLTAADAARLDNGHLPVFVMMTCLNGYFHDAALDSLAESLLKAEHGGAVAVWASSGMTLPGAQAAMNKELYRQVFSGKTALALGDAARGAKLAVSDSDVRRTWVLLGDPSMTLR